MFKRTLAILLLALSLLSLSLLTTTIFADDELDVPAATGDWSPEGSSTYKYCVVLRTRNEVTKAEVCYKTEAEAEAFATGARVGNGWKNLAKLYPLPGYDSSDGYLFFLGNKNCNTPIADYSYEVYSLNNIVGGYFNNNVRSTQIFGVGDDCLKVRLWENANFGGTGIICDGGCSNITDIAPTSLKITY